MLFSLVAMILAQAPPAPAQSLAIFDYDGKAPTEFQERSREPVDGATVADVSYASPRGGRVPAYLVTPSGRGPFAAVLFMHWGQGDRTEFLSEAVRYAKSGVVSLMIDAPYHRPDAKDFAFIADAPADTVASVVGALPHQEERDGVWDRVGRGFGRVGSWLNPFG